MSGNVHFCSCNDKISLYFFLSEIGEREKQTEKIRPSLTHLYKVFNRWDIFHIKLQYFYLKYMFIFTFDHYFIKIQILKQNSHIFLSKCLSTELYPLKNIKDNLWEPFYQLNLVQKSCLHKMNDRLKIKLDGLGYLNPGPSLLHFRQFLHNVPTINFII